MVWYYVIESGDLFHNQQWVAKGYAGALQARNNPLLQHLKNVGPIPEGRYHIGAPILSRKTGPFVLPLEPDQHNAIGRDDFQIHGDNDTHNASKGCIILDMPCRKFISSSKDYCLQVIAHVDTVINESDERVLLSLN